MRRLTPRIRVLAAIVVTAALSAGVTSVVTAGATTPSTTYYACLKAGKLTKVGTSAPTCKAGATQISWNSQGPQGSPGQFAYDWSGTVSAGSGSGNPSIDDASTVIPAGSVVQVVTGTITGNFSSCSGADVIFQPAAQNATYFSYWDPPESSVTGENVAATRTVTLPESDEAEMIAVCIDGGVAPSYSFNIEFTVLPPPTTYS